MSTDAEVIVVGGGVIGLSIAYALACEGVGSTVLDRGPLGQAASWAGAGIIAPGATRLTASPPVALRTLSAHLHAEWAEALRAETGIDTGYRRCGGVDVAATAAEERALRAAEALWEAEGIAFERLAPADFARVEPALDPSLRAADFLPDRAQIRNPRHLRALAFACERRGVRLRPGAAAEGFVTVGDRIAAVRTAEGPLHCGRVVVAAGPWSAALLVALGLDIPTPPVKGQIVLLRGARPLLGRIVERGPCYLVPRDDGRILVGATEEDAGFDTRSTPAAVRDLLRFALRTCPALAEAEVERCWAGLRPGSRDALPYIGPAPGLANLLIATGHRRAGLHLSTGTAAVVADLLLNRPPRVDLHAFRADRDPAPAPDMAFRS